MIKGAIFDFDGTLFDSMYIWEEIGEKYIKSMGFNPEKNLSKKFIKMSLEQAAKYFIDNYNINMSVQEIMDGINHFAEDYYFNIVQPKPGIKQLLDFLKNKTVKICIATATDKYLIEKALERCNMQGYFSDIFTCNLVGAGKDQPLVYREALKHLGTPKDKTVVFEDALHAAETAKKDGFKLAGIYDAHEAEQEKLRNCADIYIKSYKNTEEFIKFAEDL